MPASARELLTELPKGYEFPAIDLQVTQEEIAVYLAAVGDENAVYAAEHLAPPLAVAARALTALLELMELPAGTLHTGQELACARGVAIGANVTLRGRIAQRSERAGMIIAGIEISVTVVGEDAPAIISKSTVMSPAAGGEGPS